MLASYEAQRCKMRFNLHFLQSHIDHFLETLRACSENSGERFYQEFNDTERQYQDRRDVNLLADYYWMFRRETEVRKRQHARRNIEENKRRFQQKRVNIQG